MSPLAEREKSSTFFFVTALSRKVHDAITFAFLFFALAKCEVWWECVAVVFPKAPRMASAKREQGGTRLPPRSRFALTNNLG